MKMFEWQFPSTVENNGDAVTTFINASAESHVMICISSACGFHKRLEEWKKMSQQPFHEKSCILNLHKGQACPHVTAMH